MSRRIKITYMIDNLTTDLAGTENQLLKIIKGLNKKEFEIELITFSSNPWFRENARNLDCKSRVIEINRFKSPAAYINFLRLVRALRSSGTDIVQTFFPVANSLGVFAARAAGVRNIISSRRDFGEWMNGRYLLATRAANTMVKAILVNSDRVKELTVTREKVKEAKVTVIYNGIYTEVFTQAAPIEAAALGITPGNKVVGIVANFRPMKHHHTFVQAASDVLKHRQDVTFVMIGTGQLKEQTEQLARSLNIHGNCLFTGATKEVWKYLSVMDTGVNCSEGEGLSNAIIEYMASGVPCVVSDGGGNTDLVKHGVNGYVFPVDDHAKLAGYILELLGDSGKRMEFRTNSLRRVKEDFSMEAMLSKHERFYKNLCLS